MATRASVVAAVAVESLRSSVIEPVAVENYTAANTV
jgi:hypothetical protein